MSVLSVTLHVPYDIVSYYLLAHYVFQTSTTGMCSSQLSYGRQLGWKGVTPLSHPLSQRSVARLAEFPYEFTR